MAQAVLSVVGGMMFGPLGALAGGMIGQAIDTAGQNTNINKLDSLDSNVGQYGGTFARIYGTAQTNGVLLWSMPYIERKVKSKNSGKGDMSTTTDHLYFGNFAVKFTDAGEYELRRVWLNDKLAVDYSETNLESPGEAAQFMRFYSGSMNQNVDPLILRDKGIYAPAYRGCCYLVFQELPLANYFNQFPNVKVELVDKNGDVYVVKLNVVKNDMDIDSVRYPHEFLIPQDNNTFYSLRVGTSFGSKPGIYLEKYDSNTYQTLMQIPIAQSTLQFQGGNHSYNYIREKNELILWGETSTSKGLSVYNLNDFMNIKSFNYKDTLSDTENNFADWRKSLSTIRYLNYDFDVKRYCFIDYVAGGVRDYIYASTEAWDFGANHNISLFKHPNSVFHDFGKLHLQISRKGIVYFATNHINSTINDSQTYLSTLSSSSLNENIILLNDKAQSGVNIFIHDMLYERVSDKIFLIYTQGTSSSSGVSGEKFLCRVDPVSKTVVKMSLNSFINSTTQISFKLNYDHYNRQLLFAGVDGGVGAQNNFFMQVNVDTLTVRTNQYKKTETGNAYTDVLSSIIYNKSSNSYVYKASLNNESSKAGLIVNLGGRIKDASTTLSNVIRQEMSLTPIDMNRVITTELDSDVVLGYRVNSNASTRTVLDQLSEIFAFEAKDSQAKLHFIKSKQPITRTINEEDLGARAYEFNKPFSDLLKINRTNNFELPKNISITFYDKTKDYQLNTQSAQRATESTSQSITRQYPIVLSANDGKNIAQRMTTNAVIARDSFEFSVSEYEYATMEVGDVIRVNSYESSYVLKITDIEASQGIMRVKAVKFDSSVYTQNNTGSAGLVGQEKLEVRASSTLRLLDIPIIDKSDNNKGIYAVTAKSSKGKWQGATIYELEDRDNPNDLTFEESFEVDSILGKAEQSLIPFEDNILDMTSKVIVELSDEDKELESATDLQLDKGANLCLIGKELLQFKYASLVPNTKNKYVLRHFLRNRFGTDYAQELHDSNKSEEFILINLGNNSLKRFDKETQILNVVKYYKALTYRALSDEAPIQEFTNTGVGQKPLAVCNVQVARNGASDILVKFDKRARGRIVLVDEIEQEDIDGDFYEIDVFDSTESLKRTIESTTLEFNYTHQMQLEDFSSLAQDITLKIYKINKSYGRGFDKVVKFY